MANALEIAILPGDGIGTEITKPCVDLIQRALQQVGEPKAVENWLEAGAGAYLKHGNALPEETIAGCRSADAILLAAMGDPEVRYPDGTEIIPQIDLRFELDLYAGVRPVRSVPGIKGPLADPKGDALDFVLSMVLRTFLSMVLRILASFEVHSKHVRLSKISIYHDILKYRYRVSIFYSYRTRY